MQPEIQAIKPIVVPWQTYAVLAAGIIAVSLAAIFIRLAQAEGMSSLLISASRLGIATCVLTPITLRRYWTHIQKIKRSDMFLITISGLFLAVHFMAWTASLEYTTVLISVVLVTTSPLWSAALEVIVFKVRLNPTIMWGLCIAIAGGIIISLPGSADAIVLGSNPLLGSLLSIIGAITFAVYMVIGRKIRRKIPVIPYIWLVYGIAALTASMTVLLTATPVTGFNPEGYLWLVAVALVPQLIGHSSFNYALEHLSATYIGIITQIEPVGSAIFAYFTFREIPRPAQVFGSMVIMIGLLLASLGQTRSD